MGTAGSAATVGPQSRRTLGSVNEMRKFRAKLIGRRALFRTLCKRVVNRIVQLRWNLFDILRERRRHFVQYLQDDGEISPGNGNCPVSIS